MNVFYTVVASGIFILVFIYFSAWLSRSILRIIGADVKESVPLVSEKSIISMAALAESEGIVKPVEKQIIQNVFDFGDRKVGSVMIPMEKVYVLGVDESIQEVRENIFKKGFSRIPVVDERGLVQGILYAKDLACPDNEVPVRKLM